jgi:hypothetical protein
VRQFTHKSHSKALLLPLDSMELPLRVSTVSCGSTPPELSLSGNRIPHTLPTLTSIGTPLGYSKAMPMVMTHWNARTSRLLGLRWMGKVGGEYQVDIKSISHAEMDRPPNAQLLVSPSEDYNATGLRSWFSSLADGEETPTRRGIWC